MSVCGLCTQTLATMIGNLDSLLRAGLVSMFAWWLMRAYTGRVVKLVLGVADDVFAWM